MNQPEPCETCTSYLRHRIHVLMPAIERRVKGPFGHTTALRLYMIKVHARHRGGGSLETPTTDAMGGAR